jgi:hypothetical protein
MEKKGGSRAKNQKHLALKRRDLAKKSPDYLVDLNLSVNNLLIFLILQHGQIGLT